MWSTINSIHTLSYFSHPYTDYVVSAVFSFIYKYFYYMYYTDDGKEQQMWLTYNSISEDYKANGFSMEENGIEEYYFSNAMQINSFGEDGRLKLQTEH